MGPLGGTGLWARWVVLVSVAVTFIQMPDYTMRLQILGQCILWYF